MQSDLAEVRRGSKAVLYLDSPVVFVLEVFQYIKIIKRNEFGIGCWFVVLGNVFFPALFGTVGVGFTPYISLLMCVFP